MSITEEQQAAIMARIEAIPEERKEAIVAKLEVLYSIFTEISGGADTITVSALDDALDKIAAELDVDLPAGAAAAIVTAADLDGSGDVGFVEFVVGIIKVVIKVRIVLAIIEAVENMPEERREEIRETIEMLYELFLEISGGKDEIEVADVEKVLSKWDDVPDGAAEKIVEAAGSAGTIDFPEFAKLAINVAIMAEE
mmetsp:Transcript_12889/g.32681  ORF Transcript_12889/g.32681 Transcript_12889/m.32681 type:complete len:197 (-) Transcript_12889:38-628(-)